VSEKLQLSPPRLFALLFVVSLWPARVESQEGVHVALVLLQRRGPESQASTPPRIEAHHLIPLSQLKGKRVALDPKNDVAVLCANCHRMVHRSGYVSDVDLFRQQILKYQAT
jgi:HNH endonuclease